MKKEDLENVPEFFENYVKACPNEDLIGLLPEGGIKLYTDEMESLQKLGIKTYGKGKWTVNEIIEHLMDTERIFQARALRIARNDKTELPGYDENAYVKSSRSNEIPLGKLLMQYIAIRGATLSLYSNFNEKELKRSGTVDGNEISVATIGFILIGHPIHHFNVIKERYYPLIN